MIWKLSKEQSRKLRIELKRRAKMMAGSDEDYHYFLDDMEAKRLYSYSSFARRSEVKRLTHFKEDRACCDNSCPTLCLCELKSGEILLQRHRKGSCPFASYPEEAEYTKTGSKVFII